MVKNSVMTPSERKKHFRKHKKLKLTESDIKDIRRDSKKGIKQKVIAKSLKISASYVSRILSGEVWQHV